MVRCFIQKVGWSKRVDSRKTGREIAGDEVGVEFVESQHETKGELEGQWIYGGTDIEAIDISLIHFYKF